jgi:hypothetical protein
MSGCYRVCENTHQSSKEVGWLYNLHMTELRWMWVTPRTAVVLLPKRPFGKETKCATLGGRICSHLACHLCHAKPSRLSGPTVSVQTSPPTLPQWNWHPQIANLDLGGNAHSMCLSCWLLKSQSELAPGGQLILWHLLMEANSWPSISRHTPWCSFPFCIF